MSELSDLAARWVGQLPRPFVVELAAALRAGGSHVRKLAQQTAAPASRHAAQQAFDAAEAGDGPYLAGVLDGLRSAAAAVTDIRPVWTGPGSAVGGGRLTIAVIADLVAEATTEIVLVSYATYPPAALKQALQEAVARGVEVTMLLERTQDKPGWDGMLEPFPDLEVTRLCWPLAARRSGASLHAKVLVVDREVALVGSANLTAFALERNLECGLLIRGGQVPRMLAEHLTTAEGLAPG